MGDRWRLLVTRGLDGATNMAVDETLATLAEPGSLPILRFFDWRPWAISLGFHQDANEIDHNRCRNDGVDVVRRPTGGRAILHAEEVTYSVVIPRGHVHFSPGISKTYRIISEAIETGLRRLGLPVDFAAAARHSSDFLMRRRDVPCFASSARYEIQVGGRKLVGSAQRHYPNAVLQHGSILLGAAHLRLADYIGGSDLEKAWLKRFLATRTVCLNELANRVLDFEEVAQAVQSGFAEIFGARLEFDSLQEKELGRMEALREMFVLTKGGTKDGQATATRVGDGFASGSTRGQGAEF